MSEQSVWLNFIQSGGGKLIGMSLAYIASFLGLIFAWLSYRRREQAKAKNQGKEK